MHVWLRCGLRLRSNGSHTRQRRLSWSLIVDVTGRYLPLSLSCLFSSPSFTVLSPVAFCFPSPSFTSPPLYPISFPYLTQGSIPSQPDPRVPSQNPARRSGERCKLPSESRRGPAAKRFLVRFEHQIEHLPTRL